MQVSLLAVIALAAVLASGTVAEDITFVEDDTTSAERGQGAAAPPFVGAGEAYEYVPVPALTSMEGTVEWERMDKEWRFKEAGHPEKVYSGRKHLVRSPAWTLTLRNGRPIRGHVLGQPLYVEHHGKAERFILHQHDKGAVVQRLADLVYIRRVEFGPEACRRAVEELKGKAGAAGKTKD